MSIRNSSRDRSIGAILIDSGKLSLDDAERVLIYQREKSLKFGDAAIALGILAENDIKNALATQFEYPYLTSLNDKLSTELVAAYSPFSSQAEQLRALRSQLMLRYFSSDEEPKTLIISSPHRNEGRSYLAANLAIVFSQLGEQTLIIDADLRNPRQHMLFGLQNKVGLSSILSGRGSLEDIRRISSMVNLSVLPSGSLPPNPQELLSRQEFRSLLEKAKLNFDIIIIDTPAAIDYADAQAAAAMAEGVVLTARKNYTSLRELERCRNAFKEFNLPVVASVLSNF